MSTTNLTNPLTISLLIAFFLIIIYYLVIFVRLAFYKAKKNNAYPPAIIIIVAKDESYNLKKNLPFICEQKYPSEYEILVVDDNSTTSISYSLGYFCSQMNGKFFLRL